MASVFLSYDHEDAARAAPIAAALEKAGHLVWWDRHLHGGAEYSSEIEDAVERADAVAVLWTNRSVHSAWVRDEAAEGRDRGKLVPVLLDRVKPPMGFRQYQTIDFSSWKGGTRIPRLEQLLDSIERVSGPAGLRETIAKPERATAAGLWARLPLAWAGAAVAVLAAAVGLFLMNPFRDNGSAAVASVVAADSSAASQDYARDLLAKLGRLQSAGSEPLQLTGESGRKRADFVIEVSGALEGGQARAHLVLLDGRNATLLWSKDFERSAGESGDLRQELGYTAAQVLGCAREAHAGARLNPETLKLYLTGCAEMSAAEEASDAIPIFRRVIQAAPRFEGAWARLLTAQADAYSAGIRQDTALREQLRADVARARKVNPRLPQVYLSEATLLPHNAFTDRLRLVERAVAVAPLESAPLSHRSRELFAMGRLNDALEDARRATELDPLSPRTRGDYIQMLFTAGRFKAALKEIAEADRLWPGASSVLGAQFAFHLRYGDPAKAWQIIESGQVASVWFQGKSFLDARQHPTPANIERAIEDARIAYERHENTGYFQHLVQVLSIFDREAELLDLLMRAPMNHATVVADLTFRPAAREFWRDPRSFAYARRIGLLQAWRSSGNWPDFCFEPDLPYDCKKEAENLAA